MFQVIESNVMPQSRKSQISLIDTPYFIHDIHVVHFFEAS
ncbi:hypothetical protein GAGA_4342 [Paraglaciecola agarilytica NO2]|uniref:Uncharacterized protein n=1 Tax=Paraglaciecola agarilytica NO2 TaxID=1125747 RepID=A0ABQ0ICY7_9ALTE|nr:hypothetical protein GAGA_4342 [Paraglaciecola agarilytica NO2]